MSVERIRCSVISGAASGIGKATASLLLARGERVIGIDLQGTDVSADLSTRSGRDAAVAEVARLAPDGVDAIILCAGLQLGDNGLHAIHNQLVDLVPIKLLGPGGT